MGRFVVIGDKASIAGFALAGATLFVAERPDEVLSAWNDLPAGTVVVLLSALAATALGNAPLGRNDLFHVVLPQ
jgi:vacuolar-type H+-ATPase subunit F/Vma7